MIGDRPRSAEYFTVDYTEDYTKDYAEDSADEYVDSEDLFFEY